MKKTVMFCLIFILILSGCGKDQTARGSVSVRAGGDKTGSGKTKDSKKSMNVWDEYPEDIPGTATREEYPEDNILGLCAIASNTEEDKTTVILAFTYLADSDINDKTISAAGSIQGMATYGYFSFDETKTFREDDYYYVRLIFDSRIDLNTVLFDTGDERCNVRLKDGIQLTYCDFRKPERTRRCYQSFDLERTAWGDVEENVNDESPKETTGYSTYTKLDIDLNAYEPVSVKDDVSFTAHDYRYSQEQHNIYGEISQAADTTLRFSLLNEKDAVDTQSFFKLYIKSGSDYKDITPIDCRIDTESDNDDHRLWIDMHSSLLGELDEGDYRAEYGDYTVDFRLSVQTYEVW